MRLLAYLQSLAWCISLVHGNVEKTIFLAPEAIQIPQQHPNLEDLKLEALSPSKPGLRRQLLAAFPKSASPKGTEAWFLLDRLTQYQRYEVRICWAATVSLSTLSPHVSSLKSTFKHADGMLVGLVLKGRNSNQLPSYSPLIRYQKSSIHQN